MNVVFYRGCIEIQATESVDNIKPIVDYLINVHHCDLIDGDAEYSCILWHNDTDEEARLWYEEAKEKAREMLCQIH